VDDPDYGLLIQEHGYPMAPARAPPDGIHDFNGLGGAHDHHDNEEASQAGD
jgi:hypothetical protein